MELLTTEIEFTFIRLATGSFLIWNRTLYVVLYVKWCRRLNFVTQTKGRILLKIIPGKNYLLYGIVYKEHSIL